MEEKIIKVRFYVSTRFIGARVEDEVEIDITGLETEEEIDDAISEYFNEWVWEKVDAGWQIVE